MPAPAAVTVGRYASTCSCDCVGRYASTAAVVVSGATPAHAAVVVSGAMPAPAVVCRSHVSMGALSLTFVKCVRRYTQPIRWYAQGRVMGFVGGGGNIVIATVLPPSSRVYCIVNIK